MYEPLPMRLKFVWPGKTKSGELRALEAMHLKRIGLLANCRIVETRAARGMSEKHADKIREFEAEGLEKQAAGDYMICLHHRGKEMTSEEFAGFLDRTAGSGGRRLAFVVGGFLGLAESLLKKADFLLSLSKMTFSHELTRIILMEQVYRAVTVLKGHHYAK